MSRTARCVALATAAVVAACADASTSPHARNTPAAPAALAFDPNAYTPTVLQIDYPYDMNDAGAVIGRRDGDLNAYVQQGSTLRRLPTPNGAQSTWPTAINNRGGVVGHFHVGHFVLRGAYWDSFQAIPIQLPSFGGKREFPTDVNDSGIVVGSSENSSSVYQAFEWWPGLGSLRSTSGSLRETKASGVGIQRNTSGYTMVNGVKYPWARFGGAPIVLSSRPGQQGIGVTPGGAVILSGGEIWSSHAPITRPFSAGSFHLTAVGAGGRAVGYLGPIINRVVVPTAYTSFNGVGTTLRYPGETRSTAIAVNACGSVLAAVDVNGVPRGVLWTKATCDVGAPTF
ncbi:MAG: hypothetical protein IPK85_07760 [Gemmatimonadetes bacterium]|nr:hypothetical protein [Gemmatimonadota bacterium]